MTRKWQRSMADLDYHDPLPVLDDMERRRPEPTRIIEIDYDSGNGWRYPTVPNGRRVVRMKFGELVDVRFGEMCNDVTVQGVRYVPAPRKDWDDGEVLD